MLVDHNFPVASGSNGHRHLADIGADILADIVNFPAADPVLQLKNAEQREGALRAALWLLDAVPREGIVVKILALRFLFRLEPRSQRNIA
jgi:hypothetical protein